MAFSIRIHILNNTYTGLVVLFCPDPDLTQKTKWFKRPLANTTFIPTESGLSTCSKSNLLMEATNQSISETDTQSSKDKLTPSKPTAIITIPLTENVRPTFEKARTTSSPQAKRLAARKTQNPSENLGHVKSRRMVQYSDVIWSLKNDFKNEIRSSDQMLCEHCQKSFYSTKALINHTISSHSQVTFQCKKCDLIVKRASHLMEHYYAEHVEKEL